jgi:flagellar hook-length control protein FliK
MINGAILPKATLPTPGTAAHEPHAASQHADFAHDAHAPTHHVAREHDATRHADETPAHGEHAQQSQRSHQPRTASHTQRSARRARGARADGDERPAHDAFSRLLDQAPANGDAAKPVASASDAGVATSEVAGETPASETKAASLPDQLLGLLASLAPGAQPARASATPAQTLPGSAQMQTATSVVNATPAKPTTPPVGADAATALLPALQATGSGVTTSATATETAAATTSTLAGLRSEDPASGAALPTLRDSNHAETPAPTPFDALVRAASPTAPDVARPVVPATPTAIAQPTDPRAGYGEELGTSVMWMADQRVSHAEVRVVPEHLGPIDVRLQLDGAQVHATFLSAQPEVRHALEASLPRLRDMLGQHGLQLAHADVGQRQQDPRAMRGGGLATTGGGDAGDDSLVSMTSSGSARVVRGLLDEYA